MVSPGLLSAPLFVFLAGSVVSASEPVVSVLPGGAIQISAPGRAAAPFVARSSFTEPGPVLHAFGAPEDLVAAWIAVFHASSGAIPHGCPALKTDDSSSAVAIGNTDAQGSTTEQDRAIMIAAAEDLLLPAEDRADNSGGAGGPPGPLGPAIA